MTSPLRSRRRAWINAGRPLTDEERRRPAKTEGEEPVQTIAVPNPEVRNVSMEMRHGGCGN